MLWAAISLSFLSTNFYYNLQSFKDVKVVPRQGGVIVESMAKEIEMMMDLKVSAVRVCFILVT